MKRKESGIAHSRATGGVDLAAGSNRLELLLFKLAGPEVFGINVLKVREVTYAFDLTRTPAVGAGFVGMTSLRGQIIPVIDPATFVKARCDESAGKPGAMLVTEFNGSTQGFLVNSVDRIVQINWADVCSPAAVLPDPDGLAIGFVELAEAHLVTLLDVEAILARALGEGEMPAFESLPERGRRRTALVVDDSAFARRKIEQVLTGLDVDCTQAVSGLDAWERLNSLAARADSEGVGLAQRLDLILTDAEMPEMDGYAFTRRVKSDARFRDIPVIMHSSLTSASNAAIGAQAGVDAYVAKFEPLTLAATLRPYLAPVSAT